MDESPLCHCQRARALEEWFVRHPGALVPEEIVCAWLEAGTFHDTCPCLWATDDDMTDEA